MSFHATCLQVSGFLLLLNLLGYQISVGDLLQDFLPLLTSFSIYTQGADPRPQHRGAKPPKVIFFPATLCGDILTSRMEKQFTRAPMADRRSPPCPGHPAACDPADWWVPQCRAADSAGALPMLPVPRLRWMHDAHGKRSASGGANRCARYLICGGNESQLNSLHTSIAWEKRRYFCKSTRGFIHLSLQQRWITLVTGATGKHTQP